MRSLRIEVDDTVFEKVIAFFNKLPKRDVKLIIDENHDENDETNAPKKLNSLSLKTKGFKFLREEANER